MNARRSILVLSAVALVSAGSLFSMNHHQKTMTIVADGTDPMPYPPKPKGGFTQGRSFLVADGTDPMPYPPKPKGGFTQGRSVLVADGTDPMPFPPKHKSAAA
jgi:hypothetical protein